MFDDWEEKLDVKDAHEAAARREGSKREWDKKARGEEIGLGVAWFGRSMGLGRREFERVRRAGNWRERNGKSKEDGIMWDDKIDRLNE